MKKILNDKKAVKRSCPGSPCINIQASRLKIYRGYGKTSILGFLLI
jgi:hypothetical protein